MTTVYQARGGVHGEFCVDKGELVFQRQDTVARAATIDDAQAMARELNRMAGLAVPTSGQRGAAFSESHNLLITRVRQLKTAIISHLECGDRNFVELRAMLDGYMDAQSTADKISGQAK